MDENFELLEKQFSHNGDTIKKIDEMNNRSWELRRINSTKSLILSTEAYNLSHSISYENGIGESYLVISLNAVNIGNYLEALEKLNEAYHTFVKIGNDNGKVKALNTIGYVYNILGKNDKRLENYLMALTIAKKINNIDMIVLLLSNIGEVYKTCMHMYEEALKYLFEAFKYCEKTYNNSHSFILKNIGDTYLKLNQTDKALEYCNSGLLAAIDFNDKTAQADCYNILGKIYYKIHNNDKALENFISSLNISQETNNKFGESSALIELGSFFINIKDYTTALAYLSKALIYSEDANAGANLSNIHYLLATIYENTKEFEKSVHHYKKYIKFNDEVVTTELEKKLNALSIDSKLQQAEKDAEIYKLKNVELKEKSEEIEKKAKELEASYKNIAVINDIGQKITSSLDIEIIMNTIYENMNTLMDATIFGIGLYNEENQIIDYKMFIENSKRIPRFITAIDYENSIAAKCILDKKEMILLNIDTKKDLLYIPDDSSDVNETPPRSLVYYPLMIENRAIGTITVQSYMPNAYTEHNIATLNALASYIAIAVNNSQKSEELKATADELQNTLKNLQEAQEYLVNSEKMVALGQLISGIAHEINTPLGAIQASISNISEYMEHTIAEKIPKLFRILDENYQDLFFKMLKVSMLKDVTISSRDERNYKKDLYKTLQSINPENSDILSDNLVDMGIYNSLEQFTPLLKHPECQFILQTCYELSGILRNIKNMDLAVSKASKMLYALKSYSHNNHIDTPIVVDITEGIDTILELYNNNIKQGTELIKNYGKIPKIKCLPDELNQVWTNLIHNALQAMDYKGTLTIKTNVKGNYIVVNISDTGTGIPPEIKEKIFDPFFTTKRQGEGSGLGLGIVKKIINKHNGIIDVESTPGKTTFTINLPIDTKD